jgi:hypothetical protein
MAPRAERPGDTNMRAFARGMVAVGAIVCVLPATAAAQRSAALVAGVGVAHNAQPSAAVKNHPGEVERFERGHAVGMANGALIGAGIGAAIGLVAAPIVNAQNSDHGEDGMTYIVLPAFGVFLGLIVGGIVGWTRAP